MFFTSIECLHFKVIFLKNAENFEEVVAAPGTKVSFSLAAALSWSLQIQTFSSIPISSPIFYAKVNWSEKKASSVYCTKPHRGIKFAEQRLDGKKIKFLASSEFYFIRNERNISFLSPEIVVCERMRFPFVFQNSSLFHYFAIKYFLTAAPAQVNNGWELFFFFFLQCSKNFSLLTYVFLITVARNWIMS